MSEIESNIRINIETAGALASLKALQGQISAFHTQMAKGSATQVAAATNMQQNLINNINATGKFAASMTTVASSTETFTKALQTNKLSMGEYFRYAGGASKSFGKLFSNEFNTIHKVATERVKDLQSQYIKMGRDANGALQAIKVRPLALDMNDLGTKTAMAAQKQAILNQLLKQGSTNLLNWGKNTQWAGRQLMVGFSIPLMMVGTAAAKTYMQMETASIKLRRVYGDLSTTDAQTKAIANDVKNLGEEFTKFGIKVADTMDLAAQIAVMGKTGNDLLTQVKETQRLVALGGLSTADALQTTISLTNAFGVSMKDLATNVDFLNFSQNQTVFSIQDMSEAIPKAGPIVKQLGGDVKDLTFFMTAMKEGGINATQGANALKSGLASLINPSKAASDFLGTLGVNITSIVEKDKGNLRQTVLDVAQAMDKLDPLNRARAIEKLFGKFQFARMSTLLKNVADPNSQAQTIMNIANKSKEELSILSERELKRVADSPMFKFKKAVADLQVTLIPLGEQFVKSITPLAKFLSEALKNFNKLDGGAKSFFGNLTMWVGGFGPLILMTIGLVGNAVANIIKMFVGIKSFFNNLGKSQSSLGEQVSYLTEEQINAKAAASSLEQAHSKLQQRFTSETESVIQLTQAYKQAILAQEAMGVAGMVSRGVPVVRAATGIITGPGTGTSDSIPAMLSNGEAVIPAASVKKYPGMVAGLISGKIPGFSEGYKGVQMNLPGGAQLGHFSEPSEMTGRQLIDQAKLFGTQSQISKVLITVGNDLDQMFKTFDSRVERISDELNSTVGSVGSGKTASKSLVERDLVERGRDARTPIIDRMIKVGVSPKEALAGADQITLHIKEQLSKLGNEVRLTAEDINRITTNAYEAVAKTNNNISQAYEQQKMVETYTNRDTGRGAKGQRESFGNGYIRQRLRISKLLPKLGETSFYGASAFKTTKEMENISGMSGREISTAFKSLTPEQKTRVHAQLKESATAFVSALMSETTNAVLEGVRISTKQASPSKAAREIGIFTGEGFLQGAKEASKNSKSVGMLAGTTYADYLQKGTLRGVRSGLAGFDRFIAAPLDASFKKLSISAQIVESSMNRASVVMEEEQVVVNGLTSRIVTLFTAIGNGITSAFTKLKTVGSGKLMGAAMGVTMIPMMMSMMGGSIGELGQKLMMPVMALSMALPLLTSSIGIAVVAVGALVFGMMAYKASLDKARDEGQKLANSMSMTNDKLTKLSEVYKTVSATEARQLADKNRLGALTATGKTDATTSSLMRTGFGKSLITDIQNQLADKQSYDAIGKNVSSQLATAIMEGVISEEQARQIAKGLGDKLKNYTITANIVGNLSGLFGVGGQNLKNNPGNIAINIQKQSSKQLESLLSNAVYAQFKANGATVFDDLGQKNTKAQGALVQGSVNAFQQNQQLRDSINAQYDKLISANPNNKSLFEKQRQLALTKISSGSASMYKGLENQIINESSLGTSTTDFSNNIQSIISKSYKNDPAMEALAQESLKRTKGLKNKDLAIKLQIGLASKEFSPSTIDAIVQSSKHSASLKTNIALGITKQGSAATESLFQTINALGFTNDQKTVSKIVTMGLRKGVGFDAVTSTLTQLDSLKSVFGVSLNISTIVSNKARFGQLVKLANMKESFLTIEAATTVNGDLSADQLKILAGKDGTISRTLLLTVETLGEADIVNQFLSAKGAPYGANGLSKKAVDKIYAEALAWYKKQHPEFAALDTGSSSGGGSNSSKTKGTTPTDLIKQLQDQTKLAKGLSAFTQEGKLPTFIDLLNQADDATRNLYMTIDGKGNAVLTKKGSILEQLFNVKTVSDYIIKLKASIVQLNQDKKVKAEVLKVTKDATLQTKLMADADFKAAAAAILNDKSIKNKSKAIQDLIDLYSQLDKATTDAQNATLTESQKAEKANAVRSAYITQYQDAISSLQPQEDAINKAYDDRIAALDEISTLNQQIADSQKSQLDLADALSKGDIAAAAKTAADIRAKAVTDSIENQKTVLSKARDAQLQALIVNLNGETLTIKELTDRIATLEAKNAITSSQIIDPAAIKTAIDDNSGNNSSGFKNPIVDPNVNPNNPTLPDKPSDKSTITLPPIPTANVDLQKTIAQLTSGGSSSLTDDQKTAIGIPLITSIIKNPTPQGLVVNGIKYFANGGLAMGSDTIPAMLTPGEFVMTKSAVDRIGKTNLNGINNGADLSSPVYNSYSVTVNAATNANPNDIARVVINQIQQIGAQQLRGSRI